MAIADTWAGRGARIMRRVVAIGAVTGMALPLLGATGAGANDFSNPAPISVPLPGVPDGCPFPKGCPSEKATPYPSNIVVSGLSGTVTDVNIVLKDLTYTLSPSDVDLMVVAPGGKAVMLMSDDCGDNSEANTNAITTPITLTFDDQAPTPIPANSRCSSGTFKPFDDDSDADEFPLHMHADDFFPDAPVQAPAATVPLSTFNGIDPNGTWSLYLVDDHPNTPDPNGKAGQIAGGWTMSITTSATGATSPPAVPPAPGTAASNTVPSAVTTPTVSPAFPSVTSPTFSPATVAPSASSGTATPAVGAPGTPAPGTAPTATVPQAGSTGLSTAAGASSGAGTTGRTGTAGVTGASPGAVTQSRSGLPNSGSNSGPMALVAVGMVAVGGAMMRVAQDRIRPRAQVYIVHFRR